MSAKTAHPAKHAAAAGSDAAFRIAINLDITGSMSNEIEGVKQTVSQLIALLKELQVPLSLAILTFTESAAGCFCSCIEFAGSSLDAAQDFVQGLRLSKPPEHPSQNACGDDGDENQKAALHRMVDLEPMPTIAFLITDAAPHMKAGSGSATKTKELRWLEGRGLPPAVAADLFRVFDLVVDHYQGLLVLNCIVYNFAAHDVYGSLAQRTGGMLMQPTSRTPAVLAQGMLDVVQSLLAGLGASVAGQEGAVTSLAGFQLFDVSSLPSRDCEEDPAGNVVLGDNAAIFDIAMQRLVSVCGTKWSKRAIGMTAPAEQLEFVWRTARYVLRRLAVPADGTVVRGTDRELGALLNLRERIVAQLPEETAGHFSIDAADIQKLAASAAVLHSDLSCTADAAVSAISLESVGDALAEDADWSDWLATVMKLLHGYPIMLQLPKDKNGQPDFADAWSAVTLALGIDRISAAEFMQLLEDRATATGPSDKKEHNALLLLVEPRDVIATLVFRIASGTQVVNYVTGVLMGAKGFLPNLHAGTAAACLLRLLGSSEPLTTFQVKQATHIVHTLRSLHRPPAAAVAAQLREGRANPADAVSKLLTCAVRMSPGVQLQAGLRLVLEEWLGAMMQRYYGKGLDADEAYRKSLLQYIPLECLVQQDRAATAVSSNTTAAERADGGTTSEEQQGTEAHDTKARPLDPLRQLHPLELPVTPQLLDSLRPDWQARVMQRLRHGDSACSLPPHPVWQQFQRSAEALLHVLSPPATTTSVTATSAAGPTAADERSPADPAAAPPARSSGLSRVWSGWEQGVVRALLLRHRVARYRCVSTEGAKEPSWEPLAEAEVGSNAELAWVRVKEGHADELRGYRQARVEDAGRRLLAAAATAVRTAAGEEGVVAALRDLYLDLRPSPASPSGNAGGDTLVSPSMPATPVRPEALPRGPTATMVDEAVHRLDRGFVPDLLQALGPETITAPVLRALVMGDWTSSPPQALRRSPAVLQRCQDLALDDVLQVLRSVPRCVRQGCCNRLGHTAERPYPGPCDWDKDYAAGRVAAKPGKAAYVRQMQRFTEMAAAAKQAAVVCEVLPAGRSRAQLLAEVEAVLWRYDDANLLDRVRAKVEGLLGQQVVTAGNA